jgi:hypothetical protein
MRNSASSAFTLASNPGERFARFSVMRSTSLIYDLPSQSALYSRAFLLCAGHVHQLRGASPLANLMEVKA